jgi:hypothetical protein
VGGQPILEAKIRKISRPLVGFTIETSTLNQGKVKVSWRILEKGDGVVIQLIYAGDQNVAFQTTGSVVGQNEPVVLSYLGKLKSPEEQYASDLRFTRIFALFSFATALLIFLGWLLILRKPNYLTHPRFTAAIPFVLLCSSIGYLLIGLFILYLSWQNGPPFGF